MPRTGTHYRKQLELSDRQREVLRLMERGRTNFEIAQALGITLDGAKYHVSEILAKLDAASRESREQQKATIRDIATAAEQFRQALTAAGDTLRQDKAVLAELEAQARASSDEALRVHEAADKVLATFTAVTRELTELVRAGAGHRSVVSSIGQPPEQTHEH